MAVGSSHTRPHKKGAPPGGRSAEGQRGPSAKIGHLEAEKATEIEHLTQEKVAEVGSLQDVLWKEEFISIKLTVALALEEERMKESKIKVVDLEVQMVKLISEATARAVEEFKALPK